MCCLHLSCVVTPDASGDVSLVAGAQLVSGEWVRTWDWWMNVWVYPIYARPGPSGLVTLFPRIIQARDNSSPVHIYKWRVTAVERGKVEVGYSGFFRIVSDPNEPDSFVVFLQNRAEMVGDDLTTIAAVGIRKENDLTWQAQHETTSAFLTSNGMIIGRTTSTANSYEWEAEEVAGSTTLPLAGISDDEVNNMLFDIFDPNKGNLNGDVYIFFRGAAPRPVPVQPYL